MKLPRAVAEELKRVVGPREFKIFGRAMAEGLVAGRDPDLTLKWISEPGCGCFYAHCGFGLKPIGLCEYSSLERYLMGMDDVYPGDTPYAKTPGGRRLTAIWEHMIRLAVKGKWFDARWCR